MKVIKKTTDVLTNISTENEQKFKIDSDDSFLFDVLFEKMYSNPLRTACQEYLCNARDTMRACGKEKTPVEVIINTRDSYFVVKDRGEGITEDRMNEIFLWVGRSTKRESNKYTGSYGLGGKLAFALASSFLINTNVNGFHYEYCAYVNAESQRALTLLSKRELNPDEENGTEIRIPVRSDQINQVEPYVREIAQWWNPTVVILGRPVIPHIKPLFSGNGWVILDPKDLNRMDRKPLCICDGIPFYGNIPSSYDIHVPYSVIPVFKTGEIQLPANRENVHWCDLTVNGFKEKIANFYKEYKVHLEKDLNGLNNWHEKLLYLHNVVDIFKDEKILKDLSYKNPIKFKTPDFYSDKTTNLHSFEYVPYYSKETTRVSYEIHSIVLANSYYDYVQMSRSNKQNLANDLKSGKAYVIFNDLVDATAQEMVENLKDFEKRWTTYLARLEDYNQKKRKSRPSKPQNKEITPSAGVATKELREKLFEYIKQGKLEGRAIYIVSAPHDDIPVNYDAKLSDVKNIVLKKDVKPKAEKPSVPKTLECFRGYYRSESIDSLNNYVLLKFQTKKELLRAKADRSRDFNKVLNTLEGLDIKLAMITELEFAKIAKYEKAHNVKINAMDFEDFIVEFLKQNPGLKPSNVDDYNSFLQFNLSDNLRKILLDNAKTDIAQRVEKLKPVSHAKELVWNNKKIPYNDHTSLLNHLTSLRVYSTNLNNVLANLSPMEYNVSKAQREIEAIKQVYPLLNHCTITEKNKKDFVHYIQLINKS